MNKKVMGLIILVMFFLALTVNGAENGTKWEIFVKKDIMTGEETWIAASPEIFNLEETSPIRPLVFGDKKARLYVSYDGEKEQVFIEFNTPILLNETKWEDGYEVVNTRVKWDNKVENIQLYIDWGSHEDILLFPNDQDYVSKIIESKTMILELDWYMAGFVHFKFPLEGAAEAINEIHKKFDISKNNGYSYDMTKSSKDLYTELQFQVITRDITFTIYDDLSVDFATKVEILTENERDYNTLVEGFNTPDEEKLSLFQQSLDNLKEQIPRDFVVLSYESTVNSNSPLIYVDETVKLEGLVYRNNKGNIEFSLPGQFLSDQNEQVTVNIHYPYGWEVLSVNPTPTYIEQNVIGYSYTGAFGYPTIEFKGAENEKKWEVFIFKDEKAGKKTGVAISPLIAPTDSMGSPYSDIEAALGVGYDGKYEWVCISFVQPPNLSGTELGDQNEYDIISTRIKWDDVVETTELIYLWGSNLLCFIEVSEKVISKIINSDTMILELDWHSEGRIYFQFPLEGADEAINEIHNKFSE